MIRCFSQTCSITPRHCCLVDKQASLAWLLSLTSRLIVFPRKDHSQAHKLGSFSLWLAFRTVIHCPEQSSPKAWKAFLTAISDQDDAEQGRWIPFTPLNNLFSWNPGCFPLAFYGIVFFNLATITGFCLETRLPRPVYNIINHTSRRRGQLKLQLFLAYLDEIMASLTVDILCDFLCVSLASGQHYDVV